MVCELDSFFEVMRNSGYNAVVLHKENSLLRADVALIPSVKGIDMCILKLEFETLRKLAPTQAKYCFTTPDSFATGANFPLRNSWTDFQREMFLGSSMAASQQRASATMTQQNVVVQSNKILAQNSLAAVDLSMDSTQSGNDLRIQIFGTSDPGATTHWLKQIRIGIHADGGGSNSKPRSVSSLSRHSVESVTSVVTLHACDRRSCLGCGTLKLQALCYAAQQCSIVQCVGTVVNQNRPLCNVGLVLKSYMDGVLAMTLGAWLVFTESYTGILDAALLGPSQSTNIEWVDDAFFG
jgi:hypothetical protein